MAARAAVGAAQRGSQMVLLTLAAGQFLMTLDSSVMNVSIATVAKDVGTSVTGIQGAITLYTLVMAMLMVTEGKVGSMLGRRRAFMIGCVIYGLGSLTTALAPNLPVLVLGWSVLEGIGAALILPAIVALVAGNFPPGDRPRAYRLVMGAVAVAVAVGPLIGGAATTYVSWRWVFAGEVVLVLGILALARRVQDAPPPEGRVRLDVVGAVLIAVGLGLAVFGVLRSAEWGWVMSTPGGPSLLGVSPTVWLVIGRLLVVWLFLEWETRLEAGGRDPLVPPSIFGSRQMTGGLVMFFIEYLVQAGLFFTIPLFLSVSLGLSALATGVRILPLSITLLAAAIGIPRLFPGASPRRVVHLGLLAMFAGIVVLLAAIDADADATIVTVPLLLAGLGIGALASQLGAVTVSAVPDELSPEVGGFQNTATNLGAGGRDGAGRVAADRRPYRRVPAGRPGELVDSRAGQVPGQRPARRRGPVPVRCGSAGRAPGRRRLYPGHHRSAGGEPRREGRPAAVGPGRARAHRAGWAALRAQDPDPTTTVLTRIAHPQGEASPPESLGAGDVRSRRCSRSCRSPGRGVGGEEHIVSDEQLEELGPIDYVVLEWQGELPTTGEVQPLLLDLVDRGIVRILDIAFLTKDEDGSVAALDVGDLKQVAAAFAEFEGASSGLLGYEDLEEAAAALDPGTSAAVLVWENRWAAPVAAALRRSGGQLVASGRIPVQAVLAALDAVEAST